MTLNQFTSHYSRIIFVLIVGTFVLTMSNNVVAQTVDQNQEAINKLLNEYWTGGVLEQRAGDETWQAYEKSATRPDPKVRWAYVLNRIEHDKYREARREIDSLVSAGADAWEQRYAQVWLKLIVGEVDSALLDLQQLKSKIVAKTNLDETTRFKLFTRMGRLFGYAEGPVSGKATPSTLHDTLAIISDGLNDVDFGNFEDQRKQVTRQYAAMLNEKSTNVAAQIRDKQQNNIQRTSQITGDNARMDGRLTEVTRELSELRGVLSTELGKLQQSARPIEADLNRIDADIRRSEVRISNLSFDIGHFEHAALHEPDPYLRADLLNRASAIRSSMFSEQGFRSGLQGQYNSALSQLDLISARIADVRRQFQGQISLRKSESKQLISQQKRNQRELKKLQNPKPKTGYVRAITARTGHLPTYDPFPANEFRRTALK